MAECKKYKKRKYNKSNREINKSELYSIVNNIFNKKFAFKKNKEYVLPKPESMFIEQHWEIDELQKMKIHLNTVKSKLNNYDLKDWHKHTSQRSKARKIEWHIRTNFEPEFITQAWCKFHEIISTYPLVQKKNVFTNNKLLTLHLCEAPGAFITCLNHWLKTNLPNIHWDWLAMTFNPYYEGNSNSKMISDDRFILCTLEHWFFGHDSTGNLIDIDNLDALIEKVKSKGKVNLITADGSINCMENPSEQEKMVANLHFCEIVAAINILETGGNFLLKVFTLFEHQSICLIYFLFCIFEKIEFYKPVTSKEGNSEVYVICLEFKGREFIFPYIPTLRNVFGKDSNYVMFSKNDIPEEFIKQIIFCARFFKNHQCQAIEDNISTYDCNENLNTNYAMNRIANLVNNQFMTYFPLKKLDEDFQIIGNSKLKNSDTKITRSFRLLGSFNNWQKDQIAKPVHRLLMYKNELKHSIKLDSTILIFKFDKLQINTCINIGRPFQRIQSSRFCSISKINIFNLLFEILDVEKNDKVYLPNTEAVTKYEINQQQFWNNSYKAIYFKYNKVYNNSETIACIKETIKKLQKGDNLILFGFLLLTQFNVGLIYLLTYTFYCVEFTATDDIGYSVIFKNFKSEGLVLEEIEKIHKIADDVTKINKIVLSIIPILDLYDSDLYPIIQTVNDWTLMYCVNYIDSISEQEYK